MYSCCVILESSGDDDYDGEAKKSFLYSLLSKESVKESSLSSCLSSSFLYKISYMNHMMLCLLQNTIFHCMRQYSFLTQRRKTFLLHSMKQKLFIVFLTQSFVS